VFFFLEKSIIFAIWFSGQKRLKTFKRRSIEDWV